MARELAQLLVDEGIVAPADVERALARQREAGGSLDSAILELGLATEAQLTPLLARAARLPAAPAAAYQQVDARARRVFPAKVAERHGLAPFALDGRELSLAAAYPVDSGLLDEISFMLSLQLTAHVGVEWRVRSLIHRLYGSPLSPRLARLAEGAGGSGAEPTASPAATAAPARPSAPAEAPSPRPSPLSAFGKEVGEQAEPLAAALAQAAESFELDWEEDASRSVGAAPTPSTAAGSRPAPTPPPVGHGAPAPIPGFAPAAGLAGVAAPGVPALELEEPPVEARPEDRSAPPQWSLDQARQALADATTRDAVVLVALRYTRDFFDFAAAFAVAKDAVVGHDALGAEDGLREVCRTVAFYASEPGVVASALQSRAPYLGPVAGDAPGNAALLDGLGRESPRTSLVYPVVVRDRAVCVLYADNGAAPVSGRRLGDLFLLLSTVGAAMERIIRARKARPPEPRARPQAVFFAPVPVDEQPAESGTWAASEPALRPAAPPPMPAQVLPEPAGEQWRDSHQLDAITDLPADAATPLHSLEAPLRLGLGTAVEAAEPDDGSGLPEVHVAEDVPAAVPEADAGGEEAPERVAEEAHERLADGLEAALAPTAPTAPPAAADWAWPAPEAELESTQPTPEVAPFDEVAPVDEAAFDADLVPPAPPDTLEPSDDALWAGGLPAPVAEAPVAPRTVAEEPAVPQAYAERPYAEEPAAPQPYAERPVAEEPAAPRTVAEEPVVEAVLLEEAAIEELAATETFPPQTTLASLAAAAGATAAGATAVGATAVAGAPLAPAVPPHAAQDHFQPSDGSLWAKVVPRAPAAEPAAPQPAAVELAVPQPAAEVPTVEEPAAPQPVAEEPAAPALEDGWAAAEEPAEQATFLGEPVPPVEAMFSAPVLPESPFHDVHERRPEFGDERPPPLAIAPPVDPPSQPPAEAGEYLLTDPSISISIELPVRPATSAAPWVAEASAEPSVEPPFEPSLEPPLELSLAPVMPPIEPLSAAPAEAEASLEPPTAAAPSPATGDEDLWPTTPPSAPPSSLAAALQDPLPVETTPEVPLPVTPPALAALLAALPGHPGAADEPAAPSEPGSEAAVEADRTVSAAAAAATAVLGGAVAGHLSPDPGTPTDFTPDLTLEKPLARPGEGPRGAAGLVEDYLASPRGSEARAALLALLTQRADEVAPLLCAQLPGPLDVEPAALPRTPVPEQGPVLAAVAALGAAAAGPLLKLLGDAAPERRRAAAALLGLAGDPAALAPLADRCLDPDVAVAEAARQALASHRLEAGLKQPLEKLRRALLSGLADRSAAAARAIGTLRDAESIPLLIQALEGSDAVTAGATADALAAITLQRLGPTPRAWLLWWKQNRGKARREWLFGALTAAERETRLQAAAELREAAPSPVNYSADLPEAERQEAARAWAAWFERNGYRA